MDDTMNQDIVMVELITAGSRLSKTDCYFIAGVIRGYIEGVILPHYVMFVYCSDV